MRRFLRFVILALGTTLATVSLGSAAASAAELYVSSDGTDADNTCLVSESPCATVAHAVGQAESGDSVEIGAGEFVSDGPVSVDKNLSFVGAGVSETALVAGFDSANRNSAWFSVEDGASLDVTGLAIDGNAPDQEIGIGIRYHGDSSGVIDGVAFRDIQHPGYSGIAVGTNKSGAPDEPTTVSLDVSNSSFENIGRVGVNYKGSGVTGTFESNSYTGKGAGDHIDYALDISAGAVVDVVGNMVSGNLGVAESDGSTSGAVMLTTFYGEGTSALVSGNTISDNDAGLVVGFNAADTSSVQVNGNTFDGNEYAISATQTDGITVGAGNAFENNRFNANVPIVNVPAPYPFHLDLDNGLLDFGPFVGLDPIEDGEEVHLFGSVDADGNLSLPADEQVLPSTTFDLGGSLPSGSVAFAAADDLTGVWNESNGQVIVRGPVTATVTIDGGPVCETTDVLRFNTDRTSPYRGKRFTDGLDGAGAIVASWEGLAPFEGECAELNPFVEGPGGFWLASGMDAPQGAPVSDAAPVLSGQEFVGRQLTCNAGSWNGASQVSATWTRDGVPFDNLAGNGTTTKRTYVTGTGDIGSEIACFETGTNQFGHTASDASNPVVVADIVPVVDQAPVMTTSNGTGNQIVDVWNLGWQLRGVRGEYSNPTDNPWIGVQRSFAHAALPAPVAIDGTGGNVQYVTQPSDAGQSVLFVEVATNIFGETAAFSNETLIAAG